MGEPKLALPPMSDRDRLIEAELPSLRRYARALTREPEFADELVQECVARALSRWTLWRPTGNLRAWLFTILHNGYVNAVRRNQRTRAIFQRESAASPATQLPAQADALALRDLAAALMQLPEEQRQAVLLVGLEGFSYAEVAAITRVPVGTVMSRLSRGRDKLRALLAGEPGSTLRRVK